MIVHGLEITMLIVGIVTLVRGRFNLTASTIVRGGRAYAIGAIMLVTPFISFGTAVAVLLMMSHGGMPNDSDVLIAAGIEFGIVLLSWVPIIAIGVTQPKVVDPWEIQTDDDRGGDRPWRRRDDDFDDRGPPAFPEDRERVRRRDDDRIR